MDLFDNSFIRFGESWEPIYPGGRPYYDYGQFARLSPNVTASGREITLMAITKPANNHHVGALTVSADNSSEFRYKTTSAGPSTFLELNSFIAPARSMVAFEGHDGYVRVAVVALVRTD